MPRKQSYINTEVIVVHQLKWVRPFSQNSKKILPGSILDFTLFTEDQADRPKVHLIYQVGHIVLGGDHAGQAGPASHKPLLASLVPFLSCMCRVMVLQKICSMTFPSSKIKLTGMQCPACFSQCFFAVGLISNKIQMLKVQELNFEKCFPIT